jgi:hypothetical protein
MRTKTIEKPLSASDNRQGGARLGWWARFLGLETRKQPRFAKLPWLMRSSCGGKMEMPVDTCNALRHRLDALAAQKNE